jgi:acetylornithine deacetylase
LVELVSALVAIDSVNPDLVKGGAGELEIADFVSRWLLDHGFEVYRQSTSARGRDNIIGVLRGSGGGRTLMLNGHMDTVGTAGMDHPLDPRIVEGRLYGRGSLDAKGGLAAFMLAAASVPQRELRGDVLLTAVVDEEFGSIGTEAILREWRADGALVAEPTALDLTTCHKGFVWLEIETEGIAAHGSRPEEGADAIVQMGHVLLGLDELAGRLAAAPGHPLLGHGSVHASLISGGQELSSYPASCRLQLERRTIPGESPDDVLAEIQRLLDEISARHPSFRATARLTFSREPLSESTEADILEELRSAAESMLGHPPDYAGSAGWMDSALISAAGIPVVVFGPAGEGLHSVNEWVDLASAHSCSEIVAATIRRFSG